MKAELNSSSRNLKSNLFFPDICFAFLPRLLLMMDLFPQLSNIFGELKRLFLILLDIVKASQTRESIGRSTSLINHCLYTVDNIAHVKILQRVVLGKHFFPNH